MMLKWSKEHLQALENTFPEAVGETCTNTLLVNSGKRAVVHYVRNLLVAQENRIPTNDKVDLPRQS